MTRKIDWPENAFYHARIPGSDRHAVLLLGVEPSLRWKTFSKLVLDLARDLDVELVVTLGSLLADVPHTRAAPVTGAASDPALVESLGLQHSRYEGPTGIVGVLQDACRSEGVPAASLWAAVPHYVSLAPSPRAARALCDRLAQLLGPDRHSRARGGGGGLRRAGHEAVSTDEETAAYVAELERRTDELDLEEHETLPSGDTLAAELTRFLRERDAENGDDVPRLSRLAREQDAARSRRRARPRPRPPRRAARGTVPTTATHAFLRRGPPRRRRACPRRRARRPPAVPPSRSSASR